MRSSSISDLACIFFKSVASVNHDLNPNRDHVQYIGKNLKIIIKEPSRYSKNRLIIVRKGMRVNLTKVEAITLLKIFSQYNNYFRNENWFDKNKFKGYLKIKKKVVYPLSESTKLQISYGLFTDTIRLKLKHINFIETESIELFEWVHSIQTPNF